MRFLPVLPPFDQISYFIADLHKFGCRYITWLGQRIFEFLLDTGRLVGEDQNVFTQVHGFLNVVGDEYDGAFFFFPDLHQTFLHQIAGLRIKVTKRLIHEKDVGLIAVGARNAYALLHTAGQLVGIGVLKAFQTHKVNVGASSQRSFLGTPRTRGLYSTLPITVSQGNKAVRC